MKKVLFIEIDEFKIISGFADPIVDPEATKHKIKDAISESEELKQLKNLKKERERYTDLWIQAEKAYLLAKKQGNKEKMACYLEKYEDRKADIEQINQQIQDLKPIFKQTYSDLFDKNAIYFEPSKYEVHVEDSVYENLKSLFETNSLVDIDGNVINDYRGVYAYNNAGTWEKHIISRLNEEPDVDWIRRDDLTESQTLEVLEQKESIRIDGLTAQEKTFESDRLKEDVLEKSYVMRSKLEILSDPDALTKAQQYYTDECAAIDARYGI